MVTLWSILATLAMMASAGSFLATMYSAGAGAGILRRGAALGMVGFGILTVIAMHFAHVMP